MNEKTRRTRHGRFRALWSLTFLLLVAGACAGLFWWNASRSGGETTDADRREGPSQSPEAREFEPPEVRDLLEADDVEQRDLKLGDARKFPDCHRIFEPDGEPLDDFPLDERERREALAGCDPEAYRVLDDGRRLIGYAIPADDDGRDLRLAAFEPGGALAWSYRLDRSRYAEHFKAKFHDSFIAPLLPRMICTGTRWIDSTRVACLDADSGRARWSGAISVWTGIGLRGLGNSLAGATDEGLTRRYPFSGVEMRFKPFEETGGRSSVYAADSSRLFYASNRGESKEMVAYDLESFEVIWRLELAKAPTSSWGHAFEKLGVVLFLIDETVYAVEADSGEVLWGAAVGSDEPKVAALDGAIHMLVRRESEPNTLFAIEPQSGGVDWRSELPTGIFDMRAVERRLFLRSVRAVTGIRDLD